MIQSRECQSRAGSLYFVISGLLHATTDQDGRIVLLGRLGKGDLVGEVNVFDLVVINSSAAYGSGAASVWSTDSRRWISAAA